MGFSIPFGKFVTRLGESATWRGGEAEEGVPRPVGAAPAARPLGGGGQETDWGQASVSEE